MEEDGPNMFIPVFRNREVAERWAEKWFDERSLIQEFEEEGANDE